MTRYTNSKSNSNWRTKLSFTAITAIALLCAANSRGAAQGGWGRGDEWRAEYKIGDQVQFTISGNEADLQTCTVNSNGSGAVMRVTCRAFKQWGAGSYIVYGKSSIRPLKNSEPTKEPAQRASNHSLAGQNTTQKKWSYGDEWRSEFTIGDKIQFSISGKPADFQTCTVAENTAEAVMRVKCDAFKQWGAGTYIVHEKGYIRSTKASAKTESEPKNADGRQSATPAKPSTPPPAGLKMGEYACYGVGGRIMIGLGFKVLPGNRYTDLDGHNPGSFSVTGDTVTFRGGHLGGKTGRNLRGHSFTIGAQAGCEPY